MRSELPARTRLMRHAHALAREMDLSDDERRELAMMLPGQEGAQAAVSWATLDEVELAVMVQWLRGAQLVRDVKRLRS